MDRDTFGGGFLYHLEGGRATRGWWWDWTTATLAEPFDEMQRWKTHPHLRRILQGGKRIGTAHAPSTMAASTPLPKLVFPGGALVGCEAGFMNAARIKGSHAAIKTGMLAAQAALRLWRSAASTTS